jgi:hypothetical protein
LTARCKYKEDIVDGSIIEIMEIAILKYKTEDDILKKADSRYNIEFNKCMRADVVYAIAADDTRWAE